MFIVEEEEEIRRFYRDFLKFWIEKDIYYF